jgi:hypothetical protein
VTVAPIRLALALGATLAVGLVQSDGCGYEPSELKQEGEPCTRSSECDVGLECRGGVCMSDEPQRDAGRPRDGGMDAAVDAGPDAATDGGPDAATDADAPRDADGPDAEADAASDAEVDGSLDGG